AAVTAIGALSAQRDPQPALAVVEACGNGDLPALRGLIAGLREITAAEFQARGVAGRELGEAIRRAREGRIAAAQG
ncbi:MAG: hypothetical protein ACNA7W_18975, partial [Pseudomonadales bacterium]